MLNGLIHPDTDKRKVFEQFLKASFDRSKALTPREKLSVLKDLLDRATRADGRIEVCVGPERAMLLPADHPSVRAVLAGDRVNLANNRSINLAGARGWQERLRALPLPQKIALIVGVYLLVVGAQYAGMWLNDQRAATVLGESAVTANPTAAATTTALPAAGQATDPIPTPTPAPTSLGNQIVMNADKPAEQPSDPASLEVGAMSFVLGQGQVGKEGVWIPSGPEWLAGTYIRRVVALPKTAPGMAQLSWAIGASIRLRARDGSVTAFEIVRVEDVLRHQIEVMTEERPGLVVILVDASGDSPRRRVIVADVIQEVSMP